jgi:hypothetical protein
MEAAARLRPDRNPTKAFILIPRARAALLARDARIRACPKQSAFDPR